MNRSEAAIQEKPEHLDALLLDSAQLPLGLLRSDGTVLRANRALAAFCDTSEAELIGCRVWLAPGWQQAGLGKDQTRRAVERVARGEAASVTMQSQAEGNGVRSTELVFRGVRAGGDALTGPRIYVAVEGRPAATPNGVSSGDDAAGLRRRLDEITQVVEHAPIGLALVDCTCRFVYVNDFLAKMNGIPSPAHVGRSLREVVPDLADTLEVLYQAVLEHGEEVHGVTLRSKPLRGGDVERQWSVDLRPCLGEDGRPIGAIAAVVETTEMARAEHARLEREQQLKAFFDSAPVGLFVLDHQLRCLRVNELLAATHGITVEEHLGRTLGALGSPYAAALEQTYRDFLEGRLAPRTFELSGESPTTPGQVRHWTVSCFPISRGDHQSIWLGGLVLDVTDARVTKQALLRRTDDLAKAQSLARLTHWDLPVENGTVIWPDEIWALAGYPPNAAARFERDPMVLFAAESRPSVLATLESAIRSRAPFQLDVELVRADGERIWITTRGEPETDPGGRVTRLRGFAQDITERKYAELALRDSEQRFQQSFSHAPLGMLILESNGSITRVNHALCELVGYDETELRRMRLADLVHPDDVEAELALFGQLITGAIPSYEIEQRARRKDGRIVWTLVTRTLVATASEAAPYVISQLLDVTERKQATARVVKLSRLYAAISETNKAIVRCDTPEEVYRAVCQAGVEYGGFALAWIGVADPEAERIVPVEAAGPATAFLDDLVVSTRADVPGGRGPTGCAYREQRVCQSHDLTKHPDLGHSEVAVAAALAHGLACAISLPLRRGGRPFGTLTVYGREENYFDTEAVALLQDMADSVSFALDLFDREHLRRQTEAALRASEARLQEAQAISKMGDWELERDTGKMSWSPQLFRLFERRVSLGPPDLNEALAYYTPESLEKTRDAFWHVIDTSERAELEQVVILPSGRLRYHATVIVPVESPSGRVVKLYGTVQDVTERKLAERELIRRTEEVEDLYQNAPCGYHSLDAEGRIIRINDTELQWLGYTREEVFGHMTARDILADESRAVFDADFRQLVVNGASRTLELELRRRDGSTLPVLASTTALFDPEGKFIAARTTLADDSHRKLLERERAAYVARLTELSQHLVEVQESERRQLASELHDHASPNLAALRITFANLVSALPDKVTEELEPLLDDAYALLRDTTTGIRDICTDLRPATLDYAGLIPALREYAEQFGRRTGVSVSIAHPDHEVALPANVQSLLFRITQEALTNCAKHALASAIQIRLEDTPSAVTLRIRDDGVGFDPLLLGEGSAPAGLGLIIMKERAEFAGGRFELRSKPGEGTEITVVFDRPLESGSHSGKVPTNESGMRSALRDAQG